MRMLKTLEAYTTESVSRVVLATDSDKMRRARHIIDTVCSKAEDMMFMDYPDDASVNVFYGSTDGAIRDSVDEKQRRLWQGIATRLFGDEDTAMFNATKFWFCVRTAADGNNMISVDDVSKAIDLCKITEMEAWDDETD